MSAADRENQLADAEDRVARAQRNVKKAQDNLNKARQQATRDLEDLRKAVARASLDEEEAVANLKQAQEEYNNVMADSGSTAGDKAKAAADLKRAQADLEDTRTQNIRNQQDLNEANKKGVEGSDAVRDAADNLTDALTEQRDALYALKKAQEGQTGGGGGGGGGGALDQFQAALNKLSPSAKAFVLGIIAMKDAWDALHRSVQEAFFSRIVKDLPLISGFLPTLSNLLEKAAGAMGDVAHAGIVMVTSGPWKRDFNTLASNNVDIIHNLGAALLSLLDALRNITLAAAPFTKILTGRFAQAMANLDKLTQKSRDDGSLANWLDKVAGRLTQWWNIIKNIGATLFNYGKAASGFGDWLTTGFEKVTEGWRKASEAANDPNSGFKRWLEDIKPLLAQVKGLLGDFWAWLKRTSADPRNITTATNLLKTIRTELGPALGRLLDTFSKTGISDKLVKGISSIVDAISKLIEKGGGAGLDTFFSVLQSFFDVIDSIVSIPGVGETLGTIAGTLAAIAAIRFVAKFSGISSLINLLLSLAGKKGDLLAVFEALTGLDLTKIKGNPATTPGTTAAPGTPVSGIGAFSWVATAAVISQIMIDAATDFSSEVLKKTKNTNPGKDYDPKKAGETVKNYTNDPTKTTGLNPTAVNPGGADITDKKTQDEINKTIGDIGNWFADLWTNLTTPIGGKKGDKPWWQNVWEWLTTPIGGNDQKPEIRGGKGSSVGGGTQSSNPWENGWKQITDFFGGMDIGKWLDSINPFKGFSLDWKSIGKWLDSVNPFKGFSLDWKSIGKWFDSINPFKGFSLDWKSIGNWFDSINPFKGFSLDWKSIGNWLNSVNPFKGFNLDWKSIGSFLNSINPFKGFSIDWTSIGKWLDSVNPFKGFTIDWKSIGDWLNSVNPFKNFKLDFNSIGSWLDSINPFSSHGKDNSSGSGSKQTKSSKDSGGGGIDWSALNPFKGFKMPDFGAIFGKQNPFGDLKLPSFGGIFGEQNPFGGLVLPSFGGIFQNQVPGVKWPGFGGPSQGRAPNVGWPAWAQQFLSRVPGVGWANWAANFLSRIPGVMWANWGGLFQQRVPGVAWPNFGALFRSVLPAASTIASQIYSAVANAFSGLGGWLRSIFGSKGGAVKSGAKARKGRGTSGGGGPVNNTPSGRGGGSRAFWTGGWTARAVGGRALADRPGSERPRQVGTDTVPAMLTLGEFVLRKGVVESIGVKNLEALNEGLISYSDMLNMAMGNQKVQQKQKSTFNATGYFDGGGLAGRIANVPGAIPGVSPSQLPKQSVSNYNQGTHIGELTIVNPKPERASDTLPRTIRKMGYMGDRKPATLTPAGR